MTHQPRPDGAPDPGLPAWWAYGWWAAAGALLGFGVVSLLTIGIFVLPVAIAMVVVGCLWTPFRNEAAVAVVGGLAVATAVLAWINRQGPGTVCTTIRDGVACSEKWSPWPFAAVALLLLGAAAVAVVRTRR